MTIDILLYIVLNRRHLLLDVFSAATLVWFFQIYIYIY